MKYVGIAQFDYDKFRKDYDLRTVLGAGYMGINL